MSNNIYLAACIGLVGGFALVFYLVPKIKKIVEFRNLGDNPNQRSSHKTSTPTMAGVSFFLTLVMALSLLEAFDFDNIGINIIAALAIIFAIGLKDDLMISTPKAKIGGEILAIFCVLFCNCMQISSLDGFLGIYEIPPLASYLIIVVMILTIINSYNLIDGIDGLASTIGIAVFSVFGFVFYITGLFFYFIFCLCLIGILLAYLRYNLSKTKKIFMGDTGSLIIGFCIGILSLRFLTIDSALLADYSFNPENKILVVLSILFIPFFDTLRVFGIRLLNGKNPFSPDQNHIHHVLIKSGLTHLKASLFLATLSFVLAISFICLSMFLNSFQFFGILLISGLLLLGLFDGLRNNIKFGNKFNHFVRAIQFLF